MSNSASSHSASAPQQVTASRPGRLLVDPRGLRFSAGITAVLLIVVVFLGLLGGNHQTLSERVADPAFILLSIIALLFGWGAAAGVARHPYGALFKAAVRPRLAPPSELEDAAPPRFAQLVGFIVTGVGVVLALVGVPFAVPFAAALAFVAAFLNSAFGYCIGCQLYLLLVRSRVVA